jgi:DNA-binding NtrC family response regulator
VDCAAISATIIESELFGHVKGAFTGAHAATMGLIRTAGGGTLFLDEVGELPRGIQAKLLRTLQERQVRPVGSAHTYDVDVRIVAATHRDLAAEAAEGRFREDLLYRLNVVVLKIPPLRERKEDIPLLIRHFLTRFGNSASPVKGFSVAALDLMERYSWPGNVRELENLLRRAVALGREPELGVDDLPSPLFQPSDLHAVNTHEIPENDTLEAWEKAAIRNALNKSGGQRRKAAALLRIGEATLYRKIKGYDI